MSASTYRIKNRRDNSYLKFIVQRAPVGQWCGKVSGKTFESTDKAREYLDQLNVALAVELADDIKRMVQSAWVDGYKATRIDRMVEDFREKSAALCIEFS